MEGPGAASGCLVGEQKQQVVVVSRVCAAGLQRAASCVKTEKFVHAGMWVALVVKDPAETSLAQAHSQASLERHCERAGDWAWAARASVPSVETFWDV